jgi:hypothetical protein
VKQSEPPPAECSSTPNIFLVGRDSRGHWVARDQNGLCGGLFVDRNKAIRFAMDETGRRPQDIIMVPGVVELDMSGTAGATPRQSISMDAARERRIDSIPSLMVA